MREPKQILEESKTIAIVGLSSDPARPSLAVAQYLKDHGYRIIPVNPAEQTVLGEKAYASLRDIPETVDLVDVFRRPEATAEVAEALAFANASAPPDVSAAYQDVQTLGAGVWR